MIHVADWVEWPLNYTSRAETNPKHCCSCLDSHSHWYKDKAIIKAFASDFEIILSSLRPVSSAVNDLD